MCLKQGGVVVVVVVKGFGVEASCETKGEAIHRWLHTNRRRRHVAYRLWSATSSVRRENARPVP